MSMTRREMLEKLGLTEEEYADLMKKTLGFCKSLNEAQKRVVKSSLPSLEEAARSFGPDVSVEDFKGFVGHEIIACGVGCWEEDDEED
jgi:hypothetical protein